MNGSTETPQEAARRLAAPAIRDGYAPEALHTYTHSDGGVWYWRIRLKHADTGDKWIRPMRLNGTGYELGEPEYPAGGKPLYRLHDLAARPHDPVLVVEGEWCTDRLADRGLLTTTSGAADSAAKADWRPLAGRDVTIWPDNDEAGQRYADAVADALRALGCTVRVIDVDTLGLPIKGDAVDWLAGNPAATAADIAVLPTIEATNARARETNEQVVARLASMKPMDYDRARQAEADALGVRVTTLDAEVEKVRRKLAGDGNDSQGEAVLFPDIEPSPEPVDGGTLLTDLAATCRSYVALPKHADTAIALWIVFTHAIDVVSIAAILALTSPEKRCGKTTLLALLRRLARRSLPSANITAPSLFRAIEAWSPTLLIDEGDSFLRNSDELRGVLNSGHTRDSAFVIRTVGEDHEPRRFSTWGAKAIALIGKLPDTLADRSIELALKRKLPGEHVEKLRHADPELFRAMARRCARFVADHAEEIRAARPSMPAGLHDRAMDNWEPLLAIADLAGGPWPELAREAALALSGGDDADSEGIRVQLLGDIRGVFENRGVDRISSEDLVMALVALEERPWAEYSRGKPMTQAKLARLLRPFSVVSGSVRLPDGRTPKGYTRERFDDAFDRYLRPITPGDPPFKAQYRHNVDGTRVSEDFASATAGERGASENGPEPSCGAGCGVVADSTPPSWGVRL